VAQASDSCRVTEPSETKLVADSYERVAAEYYDPVRHPTCANFRAASASLLERLTPDVSPGHCCEVGAGDSLLADLLWRRHRDVEGLLITDAGPRMLNYSRRWAERGARLATARASELPVPDESFSLVVASLADPYDEGSLWKEVARVLTSGGRCVLTTPAVGWARRFRPDSSRAAAEFQLRDGSVVNLPSHVRSLQDERDLIEGSGLRLVAEDSISLSALDGPISGKLHVLRPDEAVVDGFVALK
jgi:SAM-dependent methyltransferase